MNLSEHFTLEMLEKSDFAKRHAIKNEATPLAIENLKFLCTEVLERVRDFCLNEFGKEFYIDSGFRSSTLNKIVGGQVNSQHLYGEAADIGVAGVTKRELFDAILKNATKYGITFDQLLLEKKNNCVHISSKKDVAKNRRQNLILK